MRYRGRDITKEAGLAQRLEQCVSGPGSRLRCDLQIITAPSALSAVRTEWLAFLQRPTVTAGFFTDLRVVLLATCFEQGDRLVIARVLLGDDLVAVVPLICRKARIAVKFGLLRLCRISASMARLADFDFPKERAVSEFDVFTTVVDAIRALQRNRSLVDIVLVDSAVVPESEARHWASRLKGVQTTYTISLSGSFRGYLDGLSSKERNNIKRRVKRLAGDDERRITIKRYRDPAEMDELCQYLLTIWKKSWHARLGQQQVPGVDYLRVLAGYGWVRSYVLFLDGEPVAYICGYQYNRIFHHEGTAYDGALQALAPGIVLLYHVIEDLFSADSPQSLDFGFGYGEYKSTFGTHPSERGMIRSAVSLRGRMIVTLLNMFDIVFRWSKALLSRTSVLRIIKMRIRGRA